MYSRRCRDEDIVLDEIYFIKDEVARCLQSKKRGGFFTTKSMPLSREQFDKILLVVEPFSRVKHKVRKVKKNCVTNLCEDEPLSVELQHQKFCDEICRN